MRLNLPANVIVLGHKLAVLRQGQAKGQPDVDVVLIRLPTDICLASLRAPVGLLFDLGFLTSATCAKQVPGARDLIIFGPLPGAYRNLSRPKYSIFTYL